MAITGSIDTRLWVNAQALSFYVAEGEGLLSTASSLFHQFRLSSAPPVLAEENQRLIRSKTTNPFLWKQILGRLITACNLPIYFKIGKNQENVNLFKILKP